MFHQKQHPKDMSSVHIELFLSHLAIDGQSSVSTQKPPLMHWCIFILDSGVLSA
ncbi:phage integrase N-terminal SAM-like domain-containing protein [Marinagarivorans algicola]|uniref:phage integrase N-terminal SAM-like domain-containing protein n=1 Tax=Marinagarivorans algicola TaxID=1513270 RepID=UPI003B75C56D